MSAAAPEMAAPDPGKTRTWWPYAHRRWEAADTVIAVVSTLIIVIFAVFFFLCWQGFGTTLEAAKKRAQVSADIVATQSSWLLGSGLTSLRLLESKLAFEPAILDAGEKAELDGALKALPSGGSFAIYDPGGAVLPNGGAPALPPSIADKPYFAALQSGAAVEIIARQDLDSATGAPIIVMARRLGGDVNAGYVVLAMPVQALEAFFNAQALTEGSVISIGREDGIIVARYPLATEPIDLTASASWELISSNPSGAYEARSALDGVTRLIGFRHVPELGIITFGSVSKDAAFAGLWSAIVIILWLLVPIALALFGGSLWTAHLLRRSAQQQRTLSAAVAHNDVLFREIHHRVKNNLQSVSSLLQMQPIPREIKANMGQRIAAMSAVHEHIYRSGNFETVHVKDYLQTLIASIRAGHDPHVSVAEDLDDLPVDREAATPLGLILNEVVSNAFKHAFADGREGMVAVRLTRTPEGRGQLTVEDNGLGFDPQTPTKGIGRRLISALTQQLGGESRFETAIDGGSLFTLTFPLASPETRPSATPLP
ncbi:MAG: ATP-binding protein [Devosia sp.]|uniref:sensor histidine kinase n=1 Tax=Devosia sp. TaxID=1871048 RepID=UPI001A4C70ED|nr:histidine kinase dimerization/phosphoacceptor domain -containing protein [Devosia sp.]MBL8598467.1 ATP-binding protein [Devosia sp.]